MKLMLIKEKRRMQIRNKTHLKIEVGLENLGGRGNEIPPSERNNCMCILCLKLLTRSKTFTTVCRLLKAEGEQPVWSAGGQGSARAGGPWTQP